MLVVMDVDVILYLQETNFRQATSYDSPFNIQFWMVYEVKAILVFFCSHSGNYCKLYCKSHLLPEVTIGCKAVSCDSVSRVWFANLRTSDGTRMKCIRRSGCINKTQSRSTLSTGIREFWSERNGFFLFLSYLVYSYCRTKVWTSFHAIMQCYFDLIIYIV